MLLLCSRSWYSVPCASYHLRSTHLLVYSIPRSRICARDVTFVCTICTVLRAALRAATVGLLHFDCTMSGGYNPRASFNAADTESVGGWQGDASINQNGSGNSGGYTVAASAYAASPTPAQNVTSPLPPHHSSSLTKSLLVGITNTNNSLSASSNGSVSPATPSTTHIQVSIRIRPLSLLESSSGLVNLWRHIEGTKSIEEVADAKRYDFDYICPPEESTADLYRNLVRRLVLKACIGYNSNVFAYGQTASGKTFTTLGSETSPGIVLLAIGDIFHYIAQSPNRQFILRISCVEIYNEGEWAGHCRGRRAREEAADDAALPRRMLTRSLCSTRSPPPRSLLPSPLLTPLSSLAFSRQRSTISSRRIPPVAV
jgi:hypothetical protein